MRTFRVVKDIPHEYITVNKEYTTASISDPVYYTSKEGHGSSYMPRFKFKECLRNGSIIFTD